MIEGLGTTIDVVLVNGVLHEGDQIVVCGMQVQKSYLVCKRNTVYICTCILTYDICNLGPYCDQYQNFVDTCTNEGAPC